MQIGVRSRPLGVTIVAIILAVIAIITLILVVLGGVVAFRLLGPHRGLETLAVLALLIPGVVALVELIIAVGLFTLKRWAYWAVVIVEAIRVAYGVFGLLVLHHSLLLTILHLVIPAVILLYFLVDGNVRRAFFPG